MPHGFHCRRFVLILAALVPTVVRYHWYTGDHDYPPAAQNAAVEWFRRWFAAGAGS